MKLCLVAGSGELPKVFLKKAREKGFEVYVVGVKGITDLPMPSKKSLMACLIFSLSIGMVILYPWKV